MGLNSKPESNPKTSSVILLTGLRELSLMLLTGLNRPSLMLETGLLELSLMHMTGLVTVNWEALGKTILGATITGFKGDWEGGWDLFTNSSMYYGETYDNIEDRKKAAE